MPWYAWALVGYYVVAAGYILGKHGESIEIDDTFVFGALIFYGLVIWVVVTLGTAA